MTEEQTWTVVQFIHDLTVEAVPSSWIQGDICYWPTFTSQRLVNAIRKCEPLNTCWPSHQIKIFRNATYDDYATARIKSKVAEETSDLASEAESYNKKRKRVQKVLSSSDESLEETILPTPPKLKVTKFGNVTHLNKVVVDKENNNTLSVTSPTDSLVNINCKGCTEKEKNFSTIINQNHMLRSLVADTLSEVQCLRAELKMFYDDNKPAINVGSIFTDLQLTFPLNSIEDIERFEDILKNDEVFNKGVNELSKLGGSNNYNFMKRALTTILSNELAVKYSWLGRKGKKPFYDTSLARLLISAAEKAKLSDSRKQSECSIQAWLKRAMERMQSCTKKFN